MIGCKAVVCDWSKAEGSSAPYRCSRLVFKDGLCGTCHYLTMPCTTSRNLLKGPPKEDSTPPPLFSHGEGKGPPPLF